MELRQSSESQWNLDLLQGLKGEYSLFREIVEGLGDLVFVKDLAGNYISANNSFARFLKRPKDKIIGSNDSVIFGIPLANEIAGHERKLTAENGAVQYALTHTVLDYTTHFECRLFLLQNSAKSPTAVVGIWRDVTREIRAEAKYRFIFDNAPIAFWEEDFSTVKLILDELRQKGVTDFETYFRTNPDILETCIKSIRITDVNLATMRMNHVLNKPKFITDIQRKFTEDSQQIFLEEFVALASGRTYFQSEATTFEVEGEKLNVLFHMNVLPGHEEDLSLVLISVIDVSNLTRTEGQLSHIKELYRSVVEGQREMICRFLPSGKVTCYNSAFQHFFERKSLNLADLKFPELFPKKTSADCLDKLSNLTKANSTCAMELHNYRADGSMVWQQWEVRSLFNAKGEAVEYQAVGTDITNRKNAEDQLVTSEARWRSIFENAEDLILTVNSSGLILTANEHVLGIEGLKLAGKLMTNLISKRYSLALSTAIQEVFERGNRVTEDIKLFRNTPSERIMSCVVTPIFHGERVLMATIIARDITESRKLENQVREALIEGQENERKRVAQELHDGIGQLFTAIKMNLQHLRSGIETDVSDSALQRLQLLEQNIGVAINEVKHISRNLMPDMLEQFGLRAALQDLVQHWNATSEVNISLEIVAMHQTFSPAVELAIFRIAQELITNAMRHSHATTIFVQLIDHTTSLVLMVEDDGDGFDPNAVKSGLGLRNIQSRTELFEGSVEIDSSIGRGTVTTIEIPVRTTKP